MDHRRIAALGCFVACMLAQGCGGSERGSFSQLGEGGDGPADPGSPPPGFDPAEAPAPSPAPAPAAPVDVVYGHSATTLYKLDPKTKNVAVVGNFDCSSEVTDLAIDESSNAYATSFSAFYAVDLATAHCSLVASGSFPNSLSFVPKGTVDPASEALVGYVGSTYVRIDPKTGSIKSLGTMSGGYVSSGDVVSVKGGGTFLTAKKTGCADCLLQVDPATGAVIQDYGSVGYGSVFGIAYWGGAVYGFTDAGELFSITASGGTVTTTPIAMPGAPSGLRFWGAGSSTSVPAAAPDGTSFPVK
ncbi:MAG: hypothetical protein KF819_31650 [Labilithrix sp.]|nr:hypothetical protein [Labilithrix sp.]